MISGKKVVVVLPAYKAEKTLRKTFEEIPMDVVDSILLVDDHSDDKTVEVAKELGIRTFMHEKNMGYGKGVSFSIDDIDCVSRPGLR